MEKKQKIRSSVRISLLTALLVAIFWGCWRLITGEVPDSIEFPPFTGSVSRLWDVPFSLISTFLVCQFVEKKITNYYLIIGIAGIISGLGFGMPTGIAFMVIFATIMVVADCLFLIIIKIISFFCWFFSKKTWDYFCNWILGRI